MRKNRASAPEELFLQPPHTFRILTLNQTHQQNVILIAAPSAARRISTSTVISIYCQSASPKITNKYLDKHIPALLLYLTGKPVPLGRIPQNPNLNPSSP
jgi:hypothetical protein